MQNNVAPLVSGDMWQNVPALVRLRNDVQSFLNAHVETGSAEDYVTIDHLVTAFTEHSLKKGETHHVNQIRSAIQDLMNLSVHLSGYKRVYRVIVGEHTTTFCWKCDKPSKYGYCNAYQFVKRVDGKRCPYNAACCELD